jgi:hypothetical protein
MGVGDDTHASEWPKVADAVIEVKHLLKTIH